MGWDVFDIDEQGGRVAIVTGANSGIGLETARCLAAKGAHVVLACRSEERGRAAIEKLSSETPGASVELRLLDLSDLGSVRSFADAFGSDHERLDLLINNAGVMMPPFSRSDAGFEMQFATNHLGHFALSGLLLPMVEASGAGRVVTVSSLAHRTGRLDFDNLDGSQGNPKRRPTAAASWPIFSLPTSCNVGCPRPDDVRWPLRHIPDGRLRSCKSTRLCFARSTHYWRKDPSPEPFRPSTLLLRKTSGAASTSAPAESSSCAGLRTR